MGTKGSDGTAAPLHIPDWLFWYQAREGRWVPDCHREWETASGVSQERQNRRTADITGSSHSDYQQPAVGSSSRWLRIEQFNCRSMNTLCQAGMAKCKDVFPQPTFLDGPLHLGSAPSQTPVFGSTISMFLGRKNTYAVSSRYRIELCRVSLRLKREARNRWGGWISHPLLHANPCGGWPKINTEATYLSWVKGLWSQEVLPISYAHQGDFQTEICLCLKWLFWVAEVTI